MHIRPASLLDFGTLQQIERACFDHDAWPILDLIAVLTYPDVERLKAIVDGRMVGFVAGDRRGDQGYSWIATIGVLPDFQRQGIGRALLEACEAKLPSPRIRLCVRIRNGSAIRMYEQAGYQRVDIWRDYYRDHGDALLMEKVR